jgi:MFS family permease
MAQQERRACFMVASLFLILLLVAGSGANTFGVFLPALLKAFPQWSRARVALLPSALFFSWGATVIPVGWLLDRVEARIVMVFGAISAGAGFLIASGSNSLAPMMVAYSLLGVGISAGTLAPGAFVIANWFHARRGLAMGMVMAGTTGGGMVMTLVANYVIQGPGWRAAYLVLGVPVIVVVVPLIVLMVRSRPPGTVKMTVAQGASLLEGFEAVEALHTRSFWMLVIANFCFGFVAVGTVVHLIAYLEGLGYKADSAALSMSVLFGMGGLGKVIIGHAADRISARLALAFDFAANALAFLMVFGAAHVSVLVLFVLVGGIGVAAPVALLPMLLAESLGLRRYGVLNALASLAGTFGATLGPLVAGRIFDLTGSYINTFEVFVLLNAIGSVAALACQPYVPGAQIRMAPESASA